MLLCIRNVHDLASAKKVRCMSNLLIPGQNAPNFDPKRPNLPQTPPKIRATPIYQDANYTVLRHKEAITPQDVDNLSLHMILIGVGLLDAHKMVPKIGKDSFLDKLKQLKKGFDDHCKAQKAIAEGWVEKEEPKK